MAVYPNRSIRLAPNPFATMETWRNPAWFTKDINWSVISCPAVVRPARTLWHEVIGFLFLALAAHTDSLGHPDASRVWTRAEAACSGSS